MDSTEILDTLALIRLKLNENTIKLNELSMDGRPLNQKGLIVTHYINVSGMSPQKAANEMLIYIEENADRGEAFKTFLFYKEYFVPVYDQQTKIEITIV